MFLIISIFLRVAGMGHFHFEKMKVDGNWPVARRSRGLAENSEIKNDELRELRKSRN